MLLSFNMELLLRCRKQLNLSSVYDVFFLIFQLIASIHTLPAKPNLWFESIPMLKWNKKRHVLNYYQIQQSDILDRIQVLFLLSFGFC